MIYRRPFVIIMVHYKGRKSCPKSRMAKENLMQKFSTNIFPINYLELLRFWVDTQHQRIPHGDDDDCRAVINATRWWWLPHDEDDCGVVMAATRQWWLYNHGGWALFDSENFLVSTMTVVSPMSLAYCCAWLAGLPDTRQRISLYIW